MITNGGFALKGHIDESAEQVYLHTWHYTQYTSFWLENKKIKIALQKGAFKQAKIEGSATQYEVQKLDSLEAGLDRDQQQTLERNYVRTHPNRYGKEINEYIQLNRPMAIGSHYTDFEQTDTAGKTVRLSDIKARYVLPDFWASWCAPCREENKDLVKTYERFKDKGFATKKASSSPQISAVRLWKTSSKTCSRAKNFSKKHLFFC